MTRFPPPRALSRVGDEYARWDAAYVLGSLSSADRHEFEAHLSSCPSCQESVAELSGMPALLAHLDRDDVAALDDGESGAPPALNPLLLTLLLAKVGRGRHRSPLRTWTVAAPPRCWRSVGWSRSSRIRWPRLRCRRRPTPRLR
jgi:anti-sigma factor RsiW